MDHRKECADICDVQVTGIGTLPLMSVDVT